MPIFYILASVLLVSAVSFTGALGVSVIQRRFKLLFALLIPLAVGALLGDAFFHLIPQAFAQAQRTAAVSFWILGGFILIFLLEKFLRWHHHSEKETTSAHLPDDKPPRYLGQLILFSDGAHNFLDGILIGVSYLASIEIGIATTIAIVLHEIPQEIGDFSILLYAGYKKATALLYNFLSALTAVVGAALVLILGSSPEGLVQYGIPFAAGAFIYIASSDLVPEIQKKTKGGNFILEILGFGAGILAMYLLLFLE